jgi:protein SCO1/2
MKKRSAVGHLKSLIIIGAMLTLGGSLALAAPKGSPWGEGYFPNVELVNQDGKTVRFYDDLIKGKVVAISFIYTHCGDSCPAETANLRQVQKLLGDRVGKDIFFYSISIDPVHDTPKVLKEYAERFRVGPGWSFLTGSKADVTLLRKTLGLFRDDVEASKLSEHSISIMIGNENTGQWVKRSPFDEPKILAWQLGRNLSSFKSYQNTNLATYASAEKLPNMSKGEDMFRAHCDSCHSLGNEDGLGPGLLGITQRRDRAWLTRWLKAPDKLLAEKDPIALDLFKRYNKILMPNLRLSDADVEAMITYLEESSKAAQKGASTN